MKKPAYTRLASFVLLLTLAAITTSDSESYVGASMRSSEPNTAPAADRRVRRKARRARWRQRIGEDGRLNPRGLDHVVVFGERHLRHLLLSYAECYNHARTHLSLIRTRQSLEQLRLSAASTPQMVGGLHHSYNRV